MYIEIKKNIKEDVMKKMFSLFVVFVLLIPFNSALPQTLDDYISERIGEYSCCKRLL